MTLKERTLATDRKGVSEMSFGKEIDVVLRFSSADFPDDVVRRSFWPKTRDAAERGRSLTVFGFGVNFAREEDSDRAVVGREAGRFVKRREDL